METPVEGPLAPIDNLFGLSPIKSTKAEGIYGNNGSNIMGNTIGRDSMESYLAISL